MSTPAHEDPDADEDVLEARATIRRWAALADHPSFFLLVDVDELSRIVMDENLPLLERLPACELICTARLNGWDHLAAAIQDPTVSPEEQEGAKRILLVEYRRMCEALEPMRPLLNRLCGPSDWADGGT